ncbi:hypothetical protein DOY81_014313, partial [Sarcophaga bullata]
MVACVILKVLMAVNGHRLLNARPNLPPVCQPNTIRPRVPYASVAGEERLSMNSVWRVLKRVHGSYNDCLRCVIHSP